MVVILEFNIFGFIHIKIKGSKKHKNPLDLT